MQALYVVTCIGQSTVLVAAWHGLFVELVLFFAFGLILDITAQDLPQAEHIGAGGQIEADRGYRYHVVMQDGIDIRIRFGLRGISVEVIT